MVARFDRAAHEVAPDRGQLAGLPGSGCDGHARVSLDVLVEAERAKRRAGATERDCVRADGFRHAYELEHGRIHDLYLCKHVEGAVALTDRSGIRLRYPADAVASLQPEFEEALWRATALGREGGQLLKGRRRLLLLEMLQSVVVYLLGVLDSQHHLLRRGDGTQPESASARIEASLGTARRELDRIDDFLRQSAQCAAQRHYLFGMAFGTLALPGVAGALTLVDLRDVPVAPLVMAVASGGIGAVLSVMTRIASGNLRVDAHAATGVTMLSGAFRPVIGAILGLAVYVLVQAGLVPLAAPTASDQAVYFFAGVAFLAGFSERWAQDMLVKTAVDMPRAGDAPPGPAASAPLYQPGRNDL